VWESGKQETLSGRTPVSGKRTNSTLANLDYSKNGA